jgi:hypothetical protein
MKAIHTIGLAAAAPLVLIITGYLGARIDRHFAPVPSVRVVAVHPGDLAPAVDADDPQAREKLARLLEDTRVRADAHWQQGYIVLRAEALFNAPDEIFITTPRD